MTCTGQLVFDNTEETVNSQMAQALKEQGFKPPARKMV